MSDYRRGTGDGFISDPVVQRFRGIDRYSNIATIAPDRAQDCMNVICSLDGSLIPLRQPKVVASFDGAGAAFTGTCYGIADFQQANGTRQIIVIFGTKIYSIAYIGGAWQAAVQVSDDADNASFWSMVSSNNLLFMANGKRMLMWDGANITRWGVKRPTNVVVIVAVNAGAGHVTLLSGRKYRAAYKNSVTGDVSSSSDPSASTGPTNMATIDVSIDAQADVAADPQIDTVVFYATLDDGVEYYWAAEVPVNKTGLTLWTDDFIDPATNPPTDQPNTSVVKQNHADTALQTQIGATWQFILSGSAQWRTVGGPNPPVGDLSVMYAHNFGFAIPDNAKITGVKVAVNMTAQSATTSYLDLIELYNGGGVLGTPKVYAPGGDTQLPISPIIGWLGFGADGEMWGLDTTTLTPAIVNDAAFGFAVREFYAQNGAGQRSFMFDFRLIVYYTIPVVTNPGTPLSTNRNAPLINDPPPLGKYLSLWSGRIFVAGLPDAPQDVAYSGYEQILDGRPESAFPPGNRLRLAVGADHVRGMVPVQAGLVIGSKSNEMFMFRGEVEDIVTGIPPAYSEMLETLPFNTGFASHYALCPTPGGLIGLTAQRSIDGYSGVGGPQTQSLPITDQLRDIPDSAEEMCQAVFYNYLDRDWYVLAYPYGVTATPNRIVVIDQAKNQDENSGIYLFDIGAFDAIQIVEDPASARPMMIVAQGGLLKEVKPIMSGTNSLTTADANDLVALAQPYWVSGWWGGPQSTKLFRHIHLVSDGGAVGNTFKVDARLVNYKTSTFRAPEVLAGLVLNEELKATVNRRSRLGAVKILFPLGTYCSVQQLWMSFMPLSER